jgi:transitional endoplasmic reticulum ATPase
MADEEKAPKLQVANMRPDDSGRGIARLPRAAMNALGLKEGDVVELIGQALDSGPGSRALSGR